LHGARGSSATTRTGRRVAARLSRAARSTQFRRRSSSLRVGTLSRPGERIPDEASDVSGSYEPYCGTAPMAGEWLHQWNLDPPLLALLLALGVAVEAALARAAPSDLRRTSGRPAAWRVGVGLVAIAFVSPLCSLAVALFSARTLQHLLLAFAAVPLLVHALPGRPAATRGRSPSAGAAVFVAIFCAWHLPGPYEATFVSDAAFWAMHVSILVAAAAFWRRLLPGAAARVTPSPDTLVALLVLMIPMGLLGAILTFAPRGLYAPHAASTVSYGLTMLEDQQIGGLLMWVPAGTLLAAIAVLVAARLATPNGQRTSNPKPSTAP
jgi:putative membrane protein